MIPSPKQLGKSPWYIRHWSNADRSRVVGNELHITCAPNKQGMDSGSGFFAIPSSFPRTSATIRYEVFVPKDFTWVKGGKIGFGFGLGPEGSVEIASGGDWKDDCGSVRCMWREDGQFIGYLYLPLEGTTRASVIKKQSPDVRDASLGSLEKDTGMEVWFKDIPKKEMLRLKKGVWNTISLHVTLNSPKKQDGVLSLTVNGVTKTLDDITYRTNTKIKLNGVVSHTFFGGSTLEWACKTPQTVSYRNIVLT